MSLNHQSTQIIVQFPDLLLLFLIASFRTWEVSNPADPRQVGAAAGVTANAHGQLVVRESDKVAFVTSGGDLIANKLFSINVAPAYQPSFIGELIVGGGGIENVGALALSSTDVFTVSQGTDELYAIDAADPAAMTQTQDYNLGTLFTVKQFGPSAIAARGTDGFVLNYQFSTPVDKSSFLVAYDFSNPAVVLQRGSVDLGLPPELDNSLRIGAVMLDGDFALCCFGATLAVVNIGDLDNLAIEFIDSAAFEAAVSAVYDPVSKLLVVLDNVAWPVGPPKLWAYDMTRPGAPRVLFTTIAPSVGFFNNAALRILSFPTRRTLYVTANGGAATATRLVTYVVDVDGSQFSLQSTSGPIATGGGAAVAVAA